ncbi:MAG: HEPN domain-containing protein [Actinobacteria bacterium]|nr:HEPN domain-containing protein [Actinomycetota bacterium]
MPHPKTRHLSCLPHPKTRHLSCHLSIEKVTKALVEQKTSREPPRSHDLLHLISLSGIEPTDEAIEFISELSNLSVATRYPVDFERTLEDFSRERAELIIEHTKETFEWIRKSIEQ